MAHAEEEVLNDLLLSSHDNENKVVQRVISSLAQNDHPICGSDNEGNEYETVDDMWRSIGILPPHTTIAAVGDVTGKLGDTDTVDNDKEETTGEKQKDDDDNSTLTAESWYWYEHSADYWEDEDNCAPTVDGMLGGFAVISDVDLEGSRLFLEEVSRMRPSLRMERCCDCGAGIGRITGGLLLPMGFKTCHLIEASARMLEAAPDYLEKQQHQLSDDQKCLYINVGLQDFQPERQSFDVIWIQWVMGYLTDRDCVLFLQRCGQSLRDHGIVCFKDNTSGTKEAFQLDKEDSSVTRSLPYIQSLAQQAGLSQIYLKMQPDFPEEIFPVPMLAFEYNNKS